MTRWSLNSEGSYTLDPGYTEESPFDLTRKAEYGSRCVRQGKYFFTEASGNDTSVAGKPIQLE
jgi:hypothetical protein